LQKKILQKKFVIYKKNSQKKNFTKNDFQKTKIPKRNISRKQKIFGKKFNQFQPASTYLTKIKPTSPIYTLYLPPKEVGL